MNTVRSALTVLILASTWATAGQTPEEMRREIEQEYQRMKSSDAAKKQGTPIPRSAPGDKGKYFLLDATRKGDIVYAVSKRIGLDSIDYSRTETNCVTRQMREMGTSYESVEKISNRPTKWFDLVPGSSKSDLARFLCKWN